jgi:hypothetical protein
MAVGNTFNEGTGLKQSLLDVMLLIVKDKVTLVNKLKEGKKPLQPVHYFDVDTIAKPSSNNAAVEGASYTGVEPADFTQNYNVTQIIRKNYSISGTMEASEYAGVKSRLAYEKKKALKQIGLDLEYAIINATGATGASGTAREMRGLAYWGSANTAATATASSGTALGSTAGESVVTDILEALYELGSPANTILMSAASKRQIDKWTANGATRFYMVESGKMNAMINVYESSFGRVELMMNTFVPDTAIYPMDTEAVKISYLRKPMTGALAKTADSMDFEALLEATVEVPNPYGVGLITLS